MLSGYYNAVNFATPEELARYELSRDEELARMHPRQWRDWVRVGCIYDSENDLHYWQILQYQGETK